MRLVTAAERGDLFRTFRREALHLEMRDFYAATDVEAQKFADWKAGKPDDFKWLYEAYQRVRMARQAGKSYRRACVVSEPLSEYQRWAYSITDVGVEAGEDLRWVPRRLVSAIPLPGNDFWLFDDEAVVFSIFSGEGIVTERQLDVPK